MKAKVFKIKYHSFIDVITNSSSELFVSTDKNVINFFKEVLKLDDIKSEGSYLMIKTFKEIKEDFGDFESLKDESFKDMNDEDLLLICDVNSESYDFIYKIMEAFKFKSMDW